MKSVPMSVSVNVIVANRTPEHFAGSPKRLMRLAGLIVCISTVAPVHAEDPQTLQEIKVTGKIEDVTERREATTQKVVMDRKEIEKLSVMTIGEVLGKLPGVEIASGGMGQRARFAGRQALVDERRLHLPPPDGRGQRADQLPAYEHLLLAVR